ncbi:hypothetical protein BCR36DRAFT_337550 [Piromyces finnis]|uniref:SGNH hydrolase n=1 Tax=Piromyces finnis TaxID=1754191 RepID=A0A1Y1UW87_9FUNG|nr:hypothetical protein BCR36DRAFT_337550 [Piromyces finnis]|eukprot:ORX42383.1 hypothetical protein BCR36DRAFT_337550 [Piromyces finnis]
MKIYNFLFSSLFIFTNVFSEKIKPEWGGSADVFLSNSNTFQYSKISNLIVFGDSHSQVGTNFKDMTYTGKNQSGGKNWPLYLMKLNNMKLWNYGVSRSVIEENVKGRPSFKSQYNLFIKNMSKGKPFSNKWNSKNSLFAIFMGFNDIFSKEKNIDLIINKYYNIIGEMYNAGARNILIFKSIPLCKACKVDKDTLSSFEKFNDLIEKKGIEFFEKHPDSNIIIYDAAEFCEDISNNCSHYGFKNCDSRWTWNQKDKMKYYFWKNSHMTSLGNKHLANNINEILNLIEN